MHNTIQYNNKSKSYYKQYNSISHIFKNIYLSNYKKACDLNELRKNNISTILFLGSKNKDIKILNMYNDNGIEHHFTHLEDKNDAKLSKCYDQTWDIINKNINKNKNILLHCNCGISRSPALVAYYLLRIAHCGLGHKLSHVLLWDILYFIYNHRPCIKLRNTFVKQLESYEKSLLI